MKKKDFIFFGGIGWCGTSSLWFTLGHLHPYIFTGSRKENIYLFALHNYLTEGFLNLPKHLLDNEISYYNPVINKLQSKGGYRQYFAQSRLNTDYEKEDALQLHPPTLQKYVEYCLEISRASEKHYRYVGDFSNPNAFLPKSFLNLVNIELSKYFNIKSLLIFRDPVRRLFSNVSSGFHYMKRYTADENDKNPTETWVRNFLETNNLRKNLPINYTQIIKNYQEVFGKENLHCSIMEEFFKDPQQCLTNPSVIELGKYLDCKIEQVYPCAFVPDKGINAPNIIGLGDQSFSDGDVLTPEFYEYCYSKLKFVYDEFKEIYGSLPEDWGKPINYGY